MIPVPKPIKEVKAKKKRKIKHTPEYLIIDKIDRLDSDICLLTNDFKCMVCGGLAGFNHHFFHKSNYGVLRFEPNNHCPICYGCHEYTIHTKGDTEGLRDTLIEKIGQEAFDRMKEKGQELANRSMPYLRSVLEVKELVYLQLIRITDDEKLKMFSNAGMKRIFALQKKYKEVTHESNNNER